VNKEAYMETGTWTGVIGSILIVVFLILYRIKVKSFFKNQREKNKAMKENKTVEKLDSNADSMLETMYKTVKDTLPRQIEEGIEWREQNLTPDRFEYVYYVDKSKSYNNLDFEKIKKSMLLKKGNIKNIADLCSKTGRSLAFRYVCEIDNTEHSIIINASDFK
jgi:hypothetical protein